MSTKALRTWKSGPTFWSSTTLRALRAPRSRACSTPQYPAFPWTVSFAAQDCFICRFTLASLTRLTLNTLASLAVFKVIINSPGHVDKNKAKAREILEIYERTEWYARTWSDPRAVIERQSSETVWFYQPSCACSDKRAIYDEMKNLLM